MMEKRRYTSFNGNSNVIQNAVVIEDKGGDIITNIIRETLADFDNVKMLYDVNEFIITEQTFIDDPIIANLVHSSSFPKRLVLTIYDDNGTVERHYVTNGANVKLVRQKDSFHQRIILLLNEALRKRGLSSQYIVEDLTRSTISEINLNMVDFLDRL